MATFSAAYGLKVNAAKSEVVFNGVAASLKADIIQVSGFQEGALPFKYLGVPIQPGRLLRRDCKILTDKIVRKVRGIGARKLSYAGRLVFINSVLNTLHNYWASIFLIPKCAIHQIEAICRNFLWDNSTEYNRAPLVAWNDICHVRTPAPTCHTKKEGGLGIKNAGMWNVASVGKLVHWLYTKADRLYGSYGLIMFTSKELTGLTIIHLQILIGTGAIFVKQGSFCLVDIRVITGKGNLLGTHPHVQWYSDVWSPWNIPKQAFIGWLVQRKALSTRFKLARLSLCSFDRCFLCETAAESHEHLFTDCVYTSKLQRKICRLAKMAVWYNVWYVRNICRLDHKVKKSEYVVAEIISQVRQRIIHKIDSIEKLKNRDWLVKLDICFM
ncbi:uncharacterized protein LOC141629610 [Silene latifolia]|uniref:uncharacterized protein LOC141629610 n=1 Tax=Silene latifolia TaxID=37657 RepID=UPI003D77B165